jgi:hypothetical protein
MEPDSKNLLNKSYSIKHGMKPCNFKSSNARIFFVYHEIACNHHIEIDGHTC